MSRLCGRPGCSEPGAVSYGMVAQDLIFWVAPLDESHRHDEPVLCRRHADAMVVPRGWTLDDRREPTPRLFRPPAPTVPTPVTRAARRTRGGDRRSPDQAGGEQLEFAAHREDAAPDAANPGVAPVTPAEQPEVTASWSPVFDTDDDLDGLLEVRSPLLARAFRGADRPRR